MKERYPSFIDALRDLDDCLSMVFLFATFPQTKDLHTRAIHLCRRLSGESDVVGYSLNMSVSGFAYDMNVTKNTPANQHPYKIIFYPIAGIYVLNALNEFLSFGFGLKYRATLSSFVY